MKKAFITGITGQDGSYLAEHLLSLDYEVHALVKPASVFTTERIDHLFNDKSIHGKRLFLYWGDLIDSSNLTSLIREIMPDEVYNLAAQSHVKISFEVPEYTANVDAMGTLRLIDAVKKIKPDARFYQASTSELYGKVREIPQNEDTPFYPRSPYAAAKLYAFWITKNYRESYDLFACNGILFNHESPRRGKTFVTRKITRAAVQIKLGTQDVLKLGNLDAKRDWGYAPEYCEAMHKMLQFDRPEDFVIATGETHSVREFCELTFAELGYRIEWNGEGVDERGVDRESGKTLIQVDKRYFRPAEVELLIGDASKAEKVLGWKAETKFEDLVKIMVKSDFENIKKTQNG